MKKKNQNNLQAKTGALLLASSLAAAVLLAGCTQTPAPESSLPEETSAPSSQATAQIESSAPALSVKAENEVVFDTQKYAEQIKNAEAIESSPQYRFSGSTLEEICQNSTELVTCQVEKVEFVTILNGQPQTKAVVKVLESLKGDLKPGDRITVYNNGGYITQDQYIKTRGLEARYSELTQKQRLNTIYEIKNADAPEERYVQAGDRYFYGLRTDPSLNGGYFPTTGPFTSYRMDANNRYTRFPDRKAKQGETPSGNSVESFTLDWMKEQVKAAAKS